MNIRPHKPEEIPLLKSIMVDAFDGVSIDQGMQNVFGDIHGHDWKWRKARHLDVDVQHDPAGIFVAEIDGDVIGFISTWCDHEAGIGHIPNISLLPESRGMGIGRKLIEYSLEHFRARGMTHAKIETLEQNEIGNHLYTSIGFREVARQVHFVCELPTEAC